MFFYYLLLIDLYIGKFLNNFLTTRKLKLIKFYIDLLKKKLYPFVSKKNVLILEFFLGRH